MKNEGHTNPPTPTKSIENANFQNTFTPPFEIPESWVWVRLGDLVEIISGTSYAKDDITSKEGIRILRGGNINDSTTQIDLFLDDIFVNIKLYDKEKIIKNDDILIVASTGSSRVIGKPAFVNEKLKNTQIGAFLRIVRNKNKNFAKYIQYIFISQHYRNYIRDLVVGTSILNIKNEYLQSFPIPLPPLQEQKYISQTLDNLFTIAKGLRVE